MSRPPAGAPSPRDATTAGIARNLEDIMSTAGDRIDAAPLPTARTLRRRRSIPRQLWRFGQINVRMLRMVRKAH
jgi:hypothetical protein